MSNPNECPPLYVPTLAECEDALHDAKMAMMELVTPGRWDFDNMKCSHSSHRQPATAGEWAEEARAAIVACRASTRHTADMAAAGKVSKADYAADDAQLTRAMDAVAALERLANV